MLSRLRRRPGDSGAVAILVVLFVLFVALPASALGVSAFVQSGARGELQQSADAAALAGAATIPLGDVRYALAYAQGLADATVLPALPTVPSTPSEVDPPGSRLPTLPLPGVPPLTPPPLTSLPTVLVDPIANACRQAVVSAGGTGGFTGSFALPTAYDPSTDPGRDPRFGFRPCGPAAAGPGVPAHAASPTYVSAQYLPDANFATALASCATTVQNTVGSTLGTYGLGLPPLPSGVDLPAFLRGLGGVLPVLLRPGVRVETHQRAFGPLDQLIGSTPKTAREQTAVSFARRRVKNVVVLPVVDPVVGRTVSVRQPVLGTTQQAKQTLLQLARTLEDPGAVVPGAVPVPTTGTPIDGELPGEVDLPGLPTAPAGVPGATIGVTPPGGGAGLGLGLPGVPLPAVPAGVPRSCTDVLRAVVDDYDDAVNPEDNPRDQFEIIEAAAQGDEPLLAILLGPNATLFDTVPVCFGEQPVRAKLSPTTADTDQDGLPDAVDLEAVVEVELDSGKVLAGTRCAPGTPGGFRASLVRG